MNQVSIVLSSIAVAALLSTGDTEASYEKAADSCESCLDGNASCGPIVRAST